MKTEKLSKLFLILVMTVLALGGLAYGLLMKEAVATTSAPDYDIVFSPPDAPLAGRAAPYGQFIVTHNGATITTTANNGTVARTNGYHKDKIIFCDVTAALTATLYARVISTGSLYTITEQIVFPRDRKHYTATSNIAPWMTLQLTSYEPGGSVVTCGFYVQTP